MEIFTYAKADLNPFVVVLCPIRCFSNFDHRNPLGTAVVHAACVCIDKIITFIFKLIWPTTLSTVANFVGRHWSSLD